MRPSAILLGEALVGLVFLGLVTLAGLPVLLLLTLSGLLAPLDLLPLLVMPFTWGAVTGLVLTVWAYESAGVRRWGERIVLGLVLLYLVVGVLAGEKLQAWLQELPESLGHPLYLALIALHNYNPFGMFATGRRRDRRWRGSGRWASRRGRCCSSVCYWDGLPAG